MVINDYLLTEVLNYCSHMHSFGEKLLAGGPTLALPTPYIISNESTKYLLCSVVHSGKV